MSEVNISVSPAGIAQSRLIDAEEERRIVASMTPKQAELYAAQKTATVKQETEKHRLMKRVTTTLTTVGSAAAAGFFTGYFPDFAPFGVSPVLWAGVAAHGLSFWAEEEGLKKNDRAMTETAETTANVGNGLISGYVFVELQAVGAKLRAAKAQKAN